MTLVLSDLRLADSAGAAYCRAQGQSRASDRGIELTRENNPLRESDGLRTLDGPEHGGMMRDRIRRAQTHLRRRGGEPRGD